MTDIDITFVEIEPDVIMVAQLPEIPGGGGGGGVQSVNGDFGPNVIIDATDITAGVFNIARIPTGTTGSTVALGNHLHTGVYDPAGSAAAAQAAAISAAATDATTKANNAQAAAVATAAADATTKANAAQAAAIAAAATDATTKANAALASANGYTDAQNANDVHLTGDQTVAGIKTFSAIPVLPGSDPSSNNQATRKLYVDNGVSGAISTAAADATTKANAAVASANGYTDSQLALAVLLTSAQSVAGVKTFSSSPIVPTPTTDFQAATKKYVDDNAGGSDFWVDYWRGVYNAGTTYNLNEIVRSVNGKGMYRCKVGTSLGVAPPNYVPGLNQVFYQRTPPPPSHDSDASALAIGFRFTPLVDGLINGVYFYKGASNTGTHVIRLWNDGTGLVVGGPTTVTGETASGWQYMAFPAPIAVTAGTIYTASTDCPNGNYEFHSQFFAAGAVTRGQVSGIMGTFGIMTTRPTGTFNNNFYATDVDFTTAIPSPDNWEVMVLGS